jgi:hypothetical protein
VLVRLVYVHHLLESRALVNQLLFVHDYVRALPGLWMRLETVELH